MSSRPLVLEAIFFETGTYEKQVARSYKAKSIGDSVLDELLELTDDGNAINSTSISPIVDSIITLDANRARKVSIPHGWDEPRLTFLICLLIDEGKANETYQILTGYTEYSDLSLDNKMDPDMKLYINNSIMINTFEVNEGGRKRRRSKVAANEILLRSSFDDDDDGDEVDVLLRAQDVFCRRDIASLPDAIGDTEITDLRPHLDGEIVFGRRSDTIASNYVSSILRAGVSAETMRRNTDYHFADIDTTVAADFDRIAESPDELAAERLRAGYATNHGAINDFMAETDFLNSGVITLGDLESSCDFENNPVVMGAGRTTGSKQYRRSRAGDFDEWGGSRKEDVLPDLIKSYVSGVLFVYNINSCSLIMTNQTHDGNCKAIITNAKGIFERFGLRPNVQAAEDALVAEVFPILSNNDALDLTVRVDFRTMEGMIIEIDHHDGRGPVVRNAAIWSDQLSTNIRADDDRILDEIANDTSDIIDEILSKNQ